MYNKSFFNEIEFVVRDKNGNEFLRKSIYQPDITDELSNLQINQIVDIELDGIIKEYIVINFNWHDYNIRGHLATCELQPHE